MIEAVNAVVSSAPLIRGQADQVDVAHAPVAPSGGQAVSGAVEGPRAPYVSPYIFVDPTYNKAVLQLRDGDSGTVEQQFPSESTLEARRRADAVRVHSEQITAKLLRAEAEAGQALPSSGTAHAVAKQAAAAPQNATPSTAQAHVDVPQVDPVQAQIASAALAKSAQINVPHSTGAGVSA